jgi:hypothetical protein
VGEPVSFDTGLITQLMEDLKTLKLPIVSKSSPGCAVVVWSIVGAVLGLAVGLLWWRGRGRA